MSEQERIIAEMQEVVTTILKSGTATVEEANKIDKLEDLLHKQRCFKEINNTDETMQGEVVATLFFGNDYEKAIDKMYEYKITPNDFFGFIEYHYDDDHEDEKLAEMFTSSFIADVDKSYELKCESNRK